LDEGHIRFHPFDPDSGLIPEIAEFGPLSERSGGCGIILIAIPDLETPAWCARAASALVTTWSSRGARILLADLSLAQPVLHDVFDLPNSKGLVDVMMDGAQLRAVGQRVGSPEFLFISAGTATGDVADVMRSDRWDVVFEALREASVDLVMYAPADLPGLDALLRRNPTVLLLGRASDVAAEAIGALGLSETGGLRPPVGEGVPGDVAPPMAPQGVPQGVPRVVPPSEELGTLWPGGSSDEPTSAADSADTAEVVDVKHARRVPYWKVAAALALLALVVWVGWSVLPRGATGSLEVLEERAERPIPVVVAPPQTPQAYSLSLAAFEDAGVAARRAGNLAGRRADVLFTSVPVLVSGRVFHRILSGPAMDSAAAEELRTSLSASLSNENSSAWILRATPFAFALGDYESREAAGRRADEISVHMPTAQRRRSPRDGSSRRGQKFRNWCDGWADMWPGHSFIMLPSLMAGDSMDLYLRERYLAAVERVTVSGSLFSGIGNPGGAIIVRSRTHA